jgi:hypothetical protein
LFWEQLATVSLGLGRFVVSLIARLLAGYKVIARKDERKTKGRHDPSVNKKVPLAKSANTIRK